MKAILVPLDFSENSKNAMDYAIVLANRLRMKLLLLHAYQPEPEIALSHTFKMYEDSIAGMTKADLVRELNIWQDAVVASEEKIECNTVFTEGNPVEVITGLLETNAIGLIVMAASGRRALKEIMCGSNTAEVIKEVSCPVITVPANYTFEHIGKIMFATDYYYSDIGAIRFMALLAKDFDAELMIVHVSDGIIKPHVEQDRLDYFMEQVTSVINYDKMSFRLIGGSEPLRSLNNLIAAGHLQLFAVSSEQKTEEDSLPANSIVRKFINHIQIPLLIFQAFDFGDKGRY